MSDTDLPGGRDVSSDEALKDALRERIGALGDPGAVIVGYAAVVEIVTPDVPGSWLKTLMDHESTPWAHVGRIAGLSQIAEHQLADGWSEDEQ